jgi:hypothetical protein
VQDMVSSQCRIASERRLRSVHKTDKHAT